MQHKTESALKRFRKSSGKKITLLEIIHKKRRLSHPVKVGALRFVGRTCYFESAQATTTFYEHCEALVVKTLVFPDFHQLLNLFETCGYSNKF